MRILHLPIILCNQPSEMVRALNKAGIKADYMVLDTQNADWLLTFNNIKWYINALELNKNDPTMRKLRKRIYSFFITQIDNYDIFHFHSNISLFSSWFGTFKDLEILKKAGKKIIVSYWGCDVRLKNINKRKKFNTCDVCTIKCDDKEKIQKRDIFARYADLKIAHMPELLNYAPPGSVMIPSLIDTNYWKSGKEKRLSNGITKILHSFGNSKGRGDIKGSDEIRKATDLLRREGYNIEFIFCDKISSSQLRPYYQKADIVIEQLRYGVYGLTALEAMSMRRPVVGYVRPEIRRYFHNELPIIDANPDNITDVLRELLQNKLALKEIGERSRQFVINHHDSKKVADLLVKAYKELLKQKNKLEKTSIEIASETRRAIGFKALLMTPNDLVGNNIMKNEAQKLVSSGYKTTIMGYAPPYPDTSISEYNKSNGYESYRFCYEFTPPLFRFYDFLSFLHIHAPITKNFSKMTILGKIFNATSQFINDILYNSSYSLRYYFLLIYQFYQKGSPMWPDVVYAKDISTLIAACYIKKVTKCYLVYDAREVNIKAKVELSRLTRGIFNILKKFYLSKVDIYITNDGFFAKKINNRLSFNPQDKIKEKSLSDIFDILLREDL